MLKNFLNRLLKLNALKHYTKKNAPMFEYFCPKSINNKTIIQFT